MYRILFIIILLIFIFSAGGCSLTWPVGGDSKNVDKQEQQDVPATGKQSAGIGQARVAEPLEGQKENPVLSPEEYGKKAAGAQETLDTLIESMRINDLSRANSCFYGFDQGEGEISIEELQREMEALHPVECRLETMRAAGKDAAIVEVIYTMPDGTTYPARPFSMTMAGEAWTVHFNSFAKSFHSMAEHLLKNNREESDSDEILMTF